jgi:hypothetical protein
MPYNLTPAQVAPGTVLPQSLSTSFVETNVYPLLSVSYNDGTFERSLIQDGVNPPRSLRTWILSKRLTTSQLTTLLNFWEVNAKGGLNPFYFYNPFDVLPGKHIGSNYDATGSNQQGRVICFFRGDWGQRTELGRHVVPALTLIEVA